MNPNIHLISVIVQYALCLLVLAGGQYSTLKKLAVPKKTIALTVSSEILIFVLQQPLMQLTALSLLLLAVVLPAQQMRRFAFWHAADILSLWTLPAFIFLVPLSHPWGWAGALAFFVLIRFVFIPRFYHHFGQIFALSFLGLSVSAWLAGSKPAACLIVGIACACAFVYVTMKPSSKKPLLLFDLDGTLIDSQPLVFETFRRVFRQLKPGYPLSQQELYSFFGPTLETTFAKYLPPDEIEDAIDLYQKINLDLHEEYLREMPHASSEMKKLHELGYEMGIVSNKRRKPVMLGLKLSGLQPCFDIVVAKEDMKKGKPDPDGLLKAAEEAGYLQDQVIYVGDNASDIQASKNAGMFSVGYTLDETQKKALKAAKPCVLIDDLDQLSAILTEDTIWIDKSIW